TSPAPAPRSSSVGKYLGQQCFDPATDVVADGTHRVEALPGRVVELPVFVALTREVGADVAATHRDDDIRVLHRVGGEDLGLLGGDVDAELGHRVDGGRVDLIRGHRSGGAHLDAVAGDVAQE